MKALRTRDGAAALHAMPGPEPLRRLVERAAERGAQPPVTAAALAAVDRYDHMLREGVGSRSLLDTILSAWDPSARREFELRRKQAAFKAISQIRGAEARVNHATVLAAPSATNPALLDIVWITGYLGLHRLRPGARVKFASRRLAPGAGQRHTTAIDGREIDAPEAMLVREFCSDPLPQLIATSAGDSIFYTMGGDAFGASSAVNLAYAELNRNELARYVPEGPARKRFFFAEIAVPSALLQFDVLLHRDLIAADPTLEIYDTAYEGAANPNDPGRALDKLDLLESTEPLGGRGGLNLRSVDVPRHTELVQTVSAAVGFDLATFAGFRTRVEYPLYGSQITVTFPGQSQ